MLFSRFGINYNTLPAVHRKGTTLVRWPSRKCSQDKTSRNTAVPSMDKPLEDAGTTFDNGKLGIEEKYEAAQDSSKSEHREVPQILYEKKNEGGIVRRWIPSSRIEILHEDVIRPFFWNSHAHLLKNCEV